eukprot:CAMPEP_0201650868 /NCGR_PEP_ID=MMETSP0493-20130528/41998_1 /ASSEMBLY_ACC=CAM_ASM_000838 /TAXON_ID=420259 /ORGANISM="Thalassiosira gravida, Strain GMp14c1" /LENGTH=44 /DNA_ID= /DNA_START= /DNA_END= /DNA_ORIENTATION=
MNAALRASSKAPSKSPNASRALAVGDAPSLGFGEVSSSEPMRSS